MNNLVRCSPLGKDRLLNWRRLGRKESVAVSNLLYLHAMERQILLLPRQSSPRIKLSLKVREFLFTEGTVHKLLETGENIYISQTGKGI